MLRLENVDVSIQTVQILRSVSLELPTGSVAGLIGRNGAGKTTLMKSIMGLLKVSNGAIRFDEIDLLRMPIHTRARMGIGYMPEDRRLIPDLTVQENVLVPAWASRIPDAAARLEKIYRSVLSWQWTRAFSPFLNLYAVIFLVGGAILSAIRYRRNSKTYYRFIGNVFIATGAILPGIGGTFTRFGYTEVLYITEVIGLTLIYLGYYYNINNKELMAGKLNVETV